MLSPRDVEQIQHAVPSGCLSVTLAAIVYEDGPTFDFFAFRLARDWRAAGLRLAGVAQVNQARPNRGRCDMVLEDLGTGRTVLISEDRGLQSRGCRLNSSALLEAGEIIRQQLTGAVDENRIGCKADEIDAVGKAAAELVFVAGQIARRLADGLKSLEAAVDSHLHIGMQWIAQMPHRGRQIGGSDKDRINTVNRGNVFDVVEGIKRFDLHDDAEFLFDLDEIIGAQPVIGGA